MTHRDWRTLLIKLIVYHFVLIGTISLLLYLVPAIEPYFPVGGLMDLEADNMTFEEVVASYREGLPSDHAYKGVARLATGALLSIAIALSLLTMWPISWVYHATHEAGKRDKTILETLFVLPIVITAIVLIIKTSVALAFGLAGIVAGVQYRNRLKLSIDAAYLFAAIAVGIACGIRAVGVAVIMSLWFCVTIVGLRLLNLTGFNELQEEKLILDPEKEQAHRTDVEKA